VQLRVELPQPPAQHAVGGHTAAHRQAADTGALQSMLGAQDQAVDDRCLIGGREVGVARLGLGLSELAQLVEQRGLQPGEGEVEAPRKCRPARPPPAT
jgi:hypothetical protein